MHWERFKVLLMTRIYSSIIIILSFLTHEIPKKVLAIALTTDFSNRSLGIPKWHFSALYYLVWGETTRTTGLIFNAKFKGALSRLRQFLATERSLKMMKNAFYFILKTLLVLKIFKFLSWILSHVKNQLD